MKKVILIGFIFSLLFSCSENDDLIKCDCSQYPYSFEPVRCESSICTSDTCQTYLDIWKSLLVSRNNMTHDYYSSHITPCRTALNKWNDGISFNVKYKLKIGWMEAELWDQFIIWLSPSSSGKYGSISLPVNSLLTKDQINSAVNIMAFNSRLNTISPLTELNYSSLEDAEEAMNLASGTDKLCFYEIYYEHPHMVIRPGGEPFLRGFGVIDWDKNRCITSQMNLRTGKVNVTFGACFIIN